MPKRCTKGCAAFAGTEPEKLDVGCVEPDCAVGAAQTLCISNLSQQELGYYVTIEMVNAGTWKEMTVSIDPNKVEREAELKPLKAGAADSILFRSERVKSIGALGPGAYRFKVFAFNGFEATIYYYSVFGVKCTLPYIQHARSRMADDGCCSRTLEQALQARATLVRDNDGAIKRA